MTKRRPPNRGESLRRDANEGEAMTQFYVTTEADVRRCKESLHAGTSVRVAGRAADGKTTMFEGVVQSVEEDVKQDPDKRWRVTLRD